MKRTIATLLFLAAAAGYAQGKGKLELGLNAGLNFSGVSDNESSSDTRYGFNLGGTADYYFSSEWSLKVRVAYDRKGWDNDIIYDENEVLHRTDYDVDYVTIPVMASWHFGPKNNWYLHAGPYIGFLTSAHDTRFDSDVKQYLNTTDAGIDFGIGVKIPVSDKIRLFIEYDGQQGFSDINKDSEIARVTNNRSALNVGINFLAN
jgi:opacity protein-like surface antigen